MFIDRERNLPDHCVSAFLPAMLYACWFPVLREDMVQPICFHHCLTYLVRALVVLPNHRQPMNVASLAPSVRGTERPSIFPRIAGEQVMSSNPL